MSPLPRSAEKFRRAAELVGLQVQVAELPGTARTAKEAAAAVGCQVGQIVKSLVFRGADSGKPLLLLISGSHEVDQTGIIRQVGEALLRPDADYVRMTTGYAIGGIPPLGHVSAIQTYMDRSLLDHSEIWAAAGTPHCVFMISPQRLQTATQADLIDVRK